MKNSHQQMALLSLLTLLLMALPLVAQNEIVSNEDAVLLRRIWLKRGAVAGGDKVGAVAGPLGDLNRDGIEDFIWGVGSTAMWHVQYGGDPIADTPVQSFALKVTVSYPIVGDFRGNDSNTVIFASYYVDSLLRLHMYLIEYGINGDTINLNPLEIGDPARTVWPGIAGTPEEFFSVDLDLDGDDEVIVIQDVLVREDNMRDTRAEIWIYEGGPDFQLDTPTVVLKDVEENFTDFYAAVGDLDGDHFPDIITSANYLGSGPGDRPVKYNFWWGKDNIRQLSVHPERTVDLDMITTNADARFALLDTDGDHVQDIARLLYGAPRGVHLYRSAIGKNIHTRSLSIDDAEGFFPGYEIFGSGGYINDSLQRYESLILLGSRLLFFSGGKNGPNYTYDAYYSTADNGLPTGNVFGRGGPISDASGDGWPDYIAANPYWYSNDQGIVILLEGGPYIPNDDTTLSVQTVTTEEHDAALHIWPNPVVDELHVAWRGDLKSPPATLRVFDLNGRQIIEGDVEGWRGEALWKCQDVPAGTYLLVVYDKRNVAIAHARIVKGP